VKKANICPPAIMKGIYAVDNPREVGESSLLNKADLHPVFLIEIMHEVRELSDIGQHCPEATQYENEHLSHSYS